MQWSYDSVVLGGHLGRPVGVSESVAQTGCARGTRAYSPRAVTVRHARVSDAAQRVSWEVLDRAVERLPQRTTHVKREQSTAWHVSAMLHLPREDTRAIDQVAVRDLKLDLSLSLSVSEPPHAPKLIAVG